MVPALYALTGKKIRQPIGGDYAFNSKYVDLFLQQEISDKIKSYGVDIFMVSLVFKYNLNYSQVKLGKKVHSLSYNKIEKFLKECFIELKDEQEYKALFLKYIYIKEGLNNNE